MFSYIIDVMLNEVRGGISQVGWDYWLFVLHSIKIIHCFN